MKKHISTLLLYAIMTLTWGCATIQSQPTHIGTWEAVDGNNTAHWIIDDTTLTSTVNGETEVQKYTIDYNKTPIWFDTIISGNHVRCIFEFLDENTFRITGEDNKDAQRLISFEGAGDIIIFRRK